MTEIPARILFVEDNPGDARLVQEMLSEVRPASYDLTHVACLEDALRALASSPVQVILADLGLPDSQGLDTVKRFLGAAPEIPVIVMSGISDEELAVQAVQAGAQDYMIKSQLDGRLILRAIRYAIERKQRERELEAVAAATAALRRARSRAEVLPVILDQLMDLLDGQSAVIASRDPHTGETVVELGRGFDVDPREEDGRAHAEILERVMRSGQTLVTRDWRPAEPSPGTERTPRAGVAAAAPLIAYEQTIGAICIARGERNSPAAFDFSPRDLRLLNAIADMAANAIQRETAHEQTVRHLERLKGLRTVDFAITSTFDVQLMLGVLLDQVTAQLGADAADVLLLDESSRMLHCGAGRGFRTTAYKNRQVRANDPQVLRVLSESRQVVVRDWRSKVSNSAIDPSQSAFLEAEGFVGVGMAALHTKGKSIGILEVFQRHPLAPDSDWLDYFDTLARQAAIGTENIRLVESLRRSNIELSVSYDATLEGWSRALELRDKETEGHTLRVAEITERLARTLGVPEDELIDLRRGALLHDIGKMGVPDSILLKPGPLTDEEWKIMHQHPQYAFDLISPIAHLRGALDIPYCHHEKWDGSGYPRGLQGRAIPLAARIFAVVDVWDALRSRRPYREPWSAERTLEHIRSLRGAHFDPEVADAFLKLVAGGVF